MITGPLFELSGFGLSAGLEGKAQHAVKDSSHTGQVPTLWRERPGMIEQDLRLQAAQAMTT